jgi:hypothetical protein
MVAALYGVSLTLPAAAHIGMWDGPILGYETLIYGWSGFGIVPELANVAILAGVIAYCNRYMILASGCAAVAFAFGITAPRVFSAAWSDLRLGYFLWMASFLVLGIFAIFNLRYDVTRVQSTAEPSGAVDL